MIGRGHRTAQRFGVVAILALAVCAFPLPTVAESDDRVPNQILVELVPGASIDDVAGRYALTVLDGVPQWNLWQTEVAPGTDVDATVDAMNLDPEVSEAEPHRRVESPEGVQETIADLDILANSATFRNQEAAQTIGTGSAHARYTGKGVRIAVIDTSASLVHAEYAERLLGAGADFAGGNGTASLQDNGLDDDQDGLIDESSNHATHVIGLIQLTAPDADVVPVRVLEEDGKGTAFGVANAILYAIHRQVDVVNLSFSLPFRSRTIERAVEDAVDAGIVVVAAAGNRGARGVEFPASHPETVAVAGVDATGVRSGFSNYGPEIDLSAPAEDVLSTYRDAEWARWSGTSFATPMVSGGVALLLQKYPCLTPARVRDVLRDTAAPDHNPDLPGEMGAGVLDLDTLSAHLDVDRCSLRAGKTAGGTVFRWSPVLGAGAYDVGRGRLDQIVLDGEVVDLGPMDCFVTGTTATDTEATPDATIPMPGETLFYLLRDDAPDAGGGTFGADGDGHPRQAGPGSCTP